MKNCFLLFLFLPLVALPQTNFEKHFLQGGLRVDFLLAGNYNTTYAYFQSMKRESWWAGSMTNLIDTMEYGIYKFEILSVETDELIFSRGFSTLFEEWKTTGESRVLDKAFYQAVTFPFPKNPIFLELYERNKKQMFNKILSVRIDPADYFIQPPEVEKYEVISLLKSGDPADHVDIVFLPEGYTGEELGKFIQDARRLSDSLFLVSPFKELKHRFNLSAVMAPSPESGSDIPGDQVWPNTILNSSFYTFNSERYLTTLDYWKVRDLASQVPCDQICILVNTQKYGGGGIYNHYSLTSVDHKLSHLIFIHEFGHGFAGLADEYYDSEVPYADFYDLNEEPWEPNITTLVNFNKKWKNYLQPGTPVPTPEIEPFRGLIGVFEGGGYVAHGIYRPQVDCRMKSYQSKGFCFICEKAIEKMIYWITD